MIILEYSQVKKVGQSKWCAERIVEDSSEGREAAEEHERVNCSIF